MSTVNYEEGLGKLQSIVDPNVELTSGALNLLSDMCNKFHTKMSNECVVIFYELKIDGKKNTDELATLHIQQAVKSIFKDKTAEFAMAEGQKALVHHYAQQLASSKTTDVKQNKRDQNVEAQAHTAFIRSFSYLCPLMFENASLTPKAKEYAAGVLLHLAKIVMYKSADISKGDNILTQQNIAEVLLDLFSESMFNHAHSQGLRYIMLFENGSISFRYKKQKLHKSLVSAPFQQRVNSLVSVAKKWQHELIYSAGIRKIVNESKNISYKLEAEAVLKIESILAFLAPKIAATAVKNAIHQNETTLKPSIMKMTVEELFPMNMTTAASSEAFKLCAQHKEGLLIFKPLVEGKTETSSATSSPCRTGDSRKPKRKRRSSRLVLKSKKARKRETETSSAESSAYDTENASDETSRKSKKLKSAPHFSFYSNMKKLQQHIQGYEDSCLTQSAAEVLHNYFSRLLHNIFIITVPIHDQDRELVRVEELHAAIKSFFPTQILAHAVTEGFKTLRNTGKRNTLNSLIQMECAYTDWLEQDESCFLEHDDMDLSLMTNGETYTKFYPPSSSNSPPVVCFPNGSIPGARSVYKQQEDEAYAGGFIDRSETPPYVNIIPSEPVSFSNHQIFHQESRGLHPEGFVAQSGTYNPLINVGSTEQIPFPDKGVFQDVSSNELYSEGFLDHSESPPFVNTESSEQDSVIETLQGIPGSFTPSISNDVYQQPPLLIQLSSTHYGDSGPTQNEWRRSNEQETSKDPSNRSSSRTSVQGKPSATQPSNPNYDDEADN